MIRMLFVVPKEGFFIIEKYSWSTHIIHGTGIFTYMDGWFFVGFHVGKDTVRPMDPTEGSIFSNVGRDTTEVVNF